MLSYGKNSEPLIKVRGYYTVNKTKKAIDEIWPSSGSTLNLIGQSQVLKHNYPKTIYLFLITFSEWAVNILGCGHLVRKHVVFIALLEQCHVHVPVLTPPINTVEACAQVLRRHQTRVL